MVDYIANEAGFANLTDTLFAAVLYCWGTELRLHSKRSFWQLLFSDINAESCEL